MKGMNRLGGNSYVDADTDIPGIINVILNFLVMSMPMTIAILNTD